MNIKSTIFKEARSQFDARGDTNFCGPMALGIVTGRNPVEIAEMMEAAGRRKKRQGCSVFDIIAQAKELGVILINRTDEVLRAGAKSVTSIVNVVDQNRNYLVGVRGHVLAVANGQVHDWTNDRKHRIKEVYEAAHPEGLGKIRLIESTIKADDKAEELVDKIQSMIDSYRAGAIKSAAEVRVRIYNRGTCYVRKSKGGFTLQYSLSGDYAAISPDGQPRMTSQYANYEYSTLNEAIAEMCRGAGIPHMYRPQPE